MRFILVPGKRPLSAATPAIVLQDDNVDLVVGASGGTKIISATFQTIVDVVDWNMDTMVAVKDARFHDQLYPDSLQLEYSFNQAIRRGLTEIGHPVDWLPLGVSYSSVQAVHNGTDGFIYGASDPRTLGQAAAL